MTCIGSGFYVGALVKYRGMVQAVLGIEYILEADFSTLYPGKRVVTYLRIGNELVSPFDVILVNNESDRNAEPIISVCGGRKEITASTGNLT